MPTSQCHIIITIHFVSQCYTSTLLKPISDKSSKQQGSHCGPFLFNIVTADIIRIDCFEGTNNSIPTSADDTKLYAIVNNIQQQLQLQQSIVRLYLWSQENSIDINIKKTFTISYSKKNATKFQSRYFILDLPIAITGIVKDLGVYFDEKFNVQISNRTPHLQRQSTICDGLQIYKGIA